MNRLALLVSLLVGLPAQAIEPEDFTFFETKIRPVLIKHCYECHSFEAGSKGKVKAGLALDSREGIRQGGDSGPSIIPGSPEKSLLLTAIKHLGPEMPPSEKLPPEVIANFEQWISQGAPDPRNAKTPARPKSVSIEESLDFWSFKVPSTPLVPDVTKVDWAINAIDRHVMTAQEQRNLEPMPDADPDTIARRIWFDLLGLPPAPDDLEEFRTSWFEGPHLAIESLVDRLIASPHFGERWGRVWLDLSRYADSNGRDRNVYFYHAWRFRNYVIDAFNADLPFDEFVCEQVAGDLLPVTDRAEQDRRRIATGFLALGAKAFEEQNPEVFRMDVIDEQIDVLSRAILGLSVGCARCHDHKFDPIPTADYYALAGIFRSTQPLYGYGPKGIKANAHAHTELQPVGPDAERLASSGLGYLARLQELTLAQNTLRSSRYRVQRNISAAKLRLKESGVQVAPIEAEIARLEADYKDWDEQVKAAELALQTAFDSIPLQPEWAMAARDREIPEDCRIHIRGETTSLGDLVPRGTLKILPAKNSLTFFTSGSGRLGLANWLSSRDNPLTARVFVNRVWRQLIGRGLVTTLDDFGLSGARPSHPELLDHLALDFMDHGWSVKRLVRQIMLSRTYRLASSAASQPELDKLVRQMNDDPENIYCWRTRPRRLEVELFRDAVLSVSGHLDRTPPQPQQEFLAKFHPYREDEYRTFKPLFLPEELEHPRRSVYSPVVRGVLPEIFQLFDFASPERTVSQRDESTIPAQALYLLNSPWIIEQSRHFARRLVGISEMDDAQRLTKLFQLAYARQPTNDERDRALEYLAGVDLVAADRLGDRLGEFDPTPDELRLERWVSFCQLIFASAEFGTLR